MAVQNVTYPLHFQFTLGERHYLYAYIRKNGCSAIKDFLVAQFLTDDIPYNQRTAILGRTYGVNRPSSLSPAPDVAFFIVRDPYERVLSFYMDKFVAMHEKEDSSKARFKNVTGYDFSQASFASFVTDYLLNVSLPDLDEHLIPQVYHLMPIVYTHVLRLSHLSDDIRTVFPDPDHQKFFLKKRHSSDQKLSRDTVSTFSGDASTMSAHELYNTLFKNGIYLSKEMFVSSDLQDAVNALYRPDKILSDAALHSTGDGDGVLRYDACKEDRYTSLACFQEMQKKYKGILGR